jgi:hypothetical protein
MATIAHKEHERIIEHEQLTKKEFFLKIKLKN